MATQYEEFATEHAAKSADNEARMHALQEAYDNSSADVGRRLLRLDKSMRVVDEVDVRGMHERVHGLVRQFDETDIFVKHLQNKVRGRRGCRCVCMPPMHAQACKWNPRHGSNLGGSAVLCQCVLVFGSALNTVGAISLSQL